MKDFLISYTDTDRPWADWIAWVLEENGCTVTTQSWDIPAGSTFAKELKDAIRKRQQTLVILSENYLQSIATRTSWSEGFWESLGSRSRSSKRSLIPIRVDNVDLTELMVPRMYIDLADKSEAEAEQAILSAIEMRQGDRSTTDTMAQQQAIATPMSASASLEKRLEFSDSEGNQLKARRRSHDVKFFVEPLSQETELKMMLIPAGVFLMGSPEDELERLDWEGPQREVRVSSFFMGKYPVTQAQWRFVAALPAVDRKLELEPSQFKGDNRPVERVSWLDAVEFCARLSAHTGREYRLPSEAEWEYACRAGTTTPFHFGETITTDLANYRGTDNKELKWSGSYGRGPKGEYRQETTPVDHFGVANAFGLCDMHGNVWEWCADHWHENYAGAPTDGSAWLSENDNNSRVLRGGSWIDAPWGCRSASRSPYSPDSRNLDICFRVVCSAPRTL